MKSSFKERLEEIDEKYSKPDKKKKKKGKDSAKPSGLNGILHGFNEKQAKGNAQNTLLKTVADLAGVGLGTAVSAATGKVAPLIGAALIGTGHYIGDDSGLLRVVGAATVAHSVAKSKEYRQENSTAMDRLKGLKDDWLRVALLKHDEESKAALPVIPKAVAAISAAKIPAKPVAKSEQKPEAFAQSKAYEIPTERRKTPYELEIETKQRAYELEADELRIEMEQDDLKKEMESQQATTEPQPDELDMSGLDEIEQFLYNSGQEQMRRGDFNPDQYDFDDVPNDHTSDVQPQYNHEKSPSKMHWPPKKQPDDEDYSG